MHLQRLRVSQSEVQACLAVEYTIEREQTADGAIITTETVKVTCQTYPQNWRAYNAAQTQEKSQLQAFCSMNCAETLLSLSNTVVGRVCPSRTSSLPAHLRFTPRFSGRRFQSDLQEAKRRGFLSRMPSYNSVFRYLEAEALTHYLYELIATSALPLKSVESDFAVNSSGFSSGQFMRWLDVKDGKEEDRR
jgi:hypothetical protein